MRQQNTNILKQIRHFSSTIFNKIFILLNHHHMNKSVLPATLPGRLRRWVDDLATLALRSAPINKIAVVVESFGGGGTAHFCAEPLFAGVLFAIHGIAYFDNIGKNHAIQ